MFSVFNLVTIGLLIILGMALKSACRTNDSLQEQVCEQRSALAMATEIRTDNAHARVEKRVSSYAVFLYDDILSGWEHPILIKEFRIDDDEDYARLMAEELCDKINESPYRAEAYVS